MLKTTSLQSWDHLISKYFSKSLRIEDRKDREHIYQIISDLGLQHEKIVAFYPRNGLGKNDLQKLVGDLGVPYWISASPLLGEEKLNRLSLLNIKSIDAGWSFLSGIEQLSKYKILVMQYPTNISYKGTALVSKEGKGIVEFVKGDHHLDLIAGKSLTDPMLFDRDGVDHYSKTISREHQDNLYRKIMSQKGHFEFQYGLLDGEICLSFFDYNDELAYEEIDLVFNQLAVRPNKTNKKSNTICTGLSACLGKVQGECQIILSHEVNRYDELKNGEILVTDYTKPEMTQMMSKAAAIVTDLGGVTSHASIICRELNIPCIVGMKIITKKVNTGDNIIVNANMGTVSRPSF